MCLCWLSFASKGASVVAFRNNALRRLTYFPITDGPTLYVTPTLQGARSGATMASAWATLLHMGMDGYTKAFKKLDGIFEAVREAVRKTDGLKLLVDSQVGGVLYMAMTANTHGLLPLLSCLLLSLMLPQEYWSSHLGLSLCII